MYKKWRRLLAAILIFCLCFSLAAFAHEKELPSTRERQPETEQTEAQEETLPTETETPAETNEPIETEVPTDTTEPVETESEPVGDEELTDEELIEKYQVPNNRFKAALLFAVRNQILYGTGDGTLSPSSHTSRAEIATILSRLFPTEHRTNLSAFTDMDSTKWYYEPISHAAAMSLISGTSSTTMSPNALATREQAFVLVARAIGMTDGDRKDLYRFNDWTKVSNWAAPSVAALVKAGYISSAGKELAPQNYITRQEVAQLIYDIVDRFSNELQQPLDGMTVTYLSSIPAGTVINGDLLLCSDTTELTLENVTVTGKLILQGVDLLDLTIIDSSIGELVPCRPVEAELDGSVDTVKVTVTGVTLSGTVENLIVYADTVLAGDAQNVVLMDGNLTVTEGASVDSLAVEYTAEGSTVTVNGTVETADINAVISLEGSGSMQEANVVATSFDPELMPESVNFTKDIGLDGVTMTGTPTSMPSVELPEAQVTLSFDGTLPTDVCDVYWTVDGELQLISGNVLLTKELLLKRILDFSGDFETAPDRKVNIRIVCRGKSKSFNFNVPVQKIGLMYNLSDVKTLDVPATVRYTTSVYSSSSLGGYLCSVSQGTKVVYRAYVGTTVAQILLPNGTLGWVPYYAISISNADCYTTKDYAPQLKEQWVNQKGYSSTTQYLVWCNLYTQHVNVFTGSKGNWKLVFTSQCASGTNYTPTPLEVTKIYYKTYRWAYAAYYVHHISVFDGSRGFHSMLYCYNSYVLYSTTMGRPASHGCVRMPDEGIMYLWDKVPVNTTVVIY